MRPYERGQTDRQKDASGFIIRPTLYYSNGTDNNRIRQMHRINTIGFLFIVAAAEAAKDDSAVSMVMMTCRSGLITS